MIKELDEYQKAVLVTANPNITGDTLKLYTIVKLGEEVGELGGPIAKHIGHGRALDLDGIKKEAGDCLYYLAWISNIWGFNLSEIATANIDKLKQRHGTTYKKEYYKPSDLPGTTEVDLGCVGRTKDT